MTSEAVTARPLAPCDQADIALRDPVLAARNSIRTLHITDLRLYLDAARTALGLNAVVYTDPSLTAGVTPVRRLHIVDLRSGTQ